MQYELRSFRDDADFEACLALQVETWGEGMEQTVHPWLQKVSLLIGGVAAGAFAANGTLLGFVWGISGFRHDRPAHWSHMLAVREEARDLGLGRALKLFQRETVLTLGIDEIYWTYDPLVARNAHLNFNRLGVGIDDYRRDFYGSGETSRLHSVIGTDRFVVVWQLSGERCRRAVAGELPDADAYRRTGIVNAGRDGGPRAPTLPPAGAGPDRLRIEIPHDVQQLKVDDPDSAMRWRASTREAFLGLAERGYEVDAFFREPATGRCFYGLRRSGGRASVPSAARRPNE